MDARNVDHGAPDTSEQLEDSEALLAAELSDYSDSADESDDDLAVDDTSEILTDPSKTSGRIDGDHQSYQPTPDVGHEDGRNAGDAALPEKAGGLGLDLEDGISNKQTTLDSASQHDRLRSYKRQNLQHADTRGWTLDQAQSFTPSDPVEIVKEMLSTVSEQYPEPYKAYISQHDLERELRNELCPNAWKVFQSRDYTRKR